MSDEGTDRLQEAEQIAALTTEQGDNAPTLALPALRQQIEDGPRGDCPECESWDGRSRRCSCGNRRMYWHWNATAGAWLAEAY